MDDLSEAGRVLARSPLYETEPVGEVAQGAFVNAVAQIETDLEPAFLLELAMSLERRYGRDRRNDAVKGPRTLDLDLLLVDDLVVNTPELSLPHPGLAERRFVLAPLCDIAPHLVHPTLGATMAELLEALPDEGPNRIDAVHRISVPQGSC